MRQVIGILLVIAGIAYFTMHGFHYSEQKKVLDIGPLQASTQSEKELLPYYPLLGGAIVAGGALLFLAGLSSSRRH